jgi:lipoate-protein ligase A
VAACRSLGIAAELTPGEVNLQLPGPASTIPCFEAPAGGEVVVGGRKLIGSAMRAHGGAVLQHGAILLDWDGRLQAGSMGLPDDRSLRASVTTMAEQLGRPCALPELVQTLLAAFSQVFGVALVEGLLSDAEARQEILSEASFRVD